MYGFYLKSIVRWVVECETHELVPSRALFSQ